MGPTPVSARQGLLMGTYRAGSRRRQGYGGPGTDLPLKLFWLFHIP